ncbi:hydroxyacid dehydrogenase [Puniceicoccaceae bacterium K14]|nr:hydroxyacid dehydrogenase [Puniceicoccaceae bacterium K14]
MSKIKTVIMADDVSFHQGDIVEFVYGADRCEHIAKQTDLHPTRITSKNIEDEIDNLGQVEAIFSCWGMPSLDAKMIEKMPSLKAVFYAGGSVDHFARPFLDKGIKVINAIEANAIPVAEFCLAQILLSLKGAYRNMRLCKTGPWIQSDMPVGKGAYGETIGLIGVGFVSRHLLSLLKPLNLRVIAVSPELSENPGDAHTLGIHELVSIEEVFAQSYVISNHLCETKENYKILKESHFKSMRQDATFINTGRGTQVDEEGLVKTLKQRPDLNALLDVQHPEPPPIGSPFYQLENVYMTSHIAGSSNDEIQRMADFIIEDFERWRAGRPLRNKVVS